MLANEFTPDQFYAHLDWPVQWGDQDLFGHVNNTVYFRWFESARIRFLELLGLAKLHDPKEEHGPILVHAGCNFRRQLEYPDTIKIGSRVARVGTTSFTLEHALWSHARGMALAADGTSVIVTFNYRTQQPIRVPDELRRAIEKLEGKKFE